MIIKSDLFKFVARMLFTQNSPAIACRHASNRTCAMMPCPINLSQLRHMGHQQLSRSHHSTALRSRAITAYSIPNDDFDSTLISRRALSSLEQPNSYPLPRAESASSSSVGSTSEVSDSETGGLSLEEVLEHKKAAIQQAFLNDSLGFGFSAGTVHVKLMASSAWACSITRLLHSLQLFACLLLCVLPFCAWCSWREFFLGVHCRH